MDIITTDPYVNEREPENEPALLLEELEPGDLFRLHEHGFDEAIQNQELYLMLDEPIDEDHLPCANLHTGSFKLMARTIEVHPHMATLDVIPNI